MKKFLIFLLVVAGCAIGPALCWVLLCPGSMEQRVGTLIMGLVVDLVLLCCLGIASKATED